MAKDDMELLRDYAIRRSEVAFETLVARHINFVYSAALRQTRDPHLAEEATQAVFILLARKAGSLNPRTILPGWLYRTTRFTVANLLKIKSAREQREQKAYMESTIEAAPEDTTWLEMSPLLEEGMARLRDTDRDALLLRYFQNKSLREVGEALGTNEESAKKRVARSLERLRVFFSRRGVVVSTTVIAGAVSANSLQAAPVGLVAAISASAATSVAVGSSSTFVHSILKLMAGIKIKTVVVAGVAILLTAGTTTVIVKATSPTEPAYQGKYLSEWLELLFRSTDLTVQHGFTESERLEVQAKAKEAIVQMGTNSFPYLLAELDPAHAGRFIIKKFKYSTDERDRLDAVAGAFRALGETAQPAIPTIAKILNNSDSPDSLIGAILVSLGPESVGPLTNALANPTANVRATAAWSLGNYAVPGLWGATEPAEVDPLAEVIIPKLLQALHDRSPDVRGTAAISLGRFKRQPEVVVPALIGLLADRDYLPREAAARALGSYGEQAQSAVEPLVAALKDPIKVVSTEAGKSLKLIDPKAAASAGVK